MNPNVTKVTIEHLQSLVGNKAHMLQVLDMEGMIIRVLPSSTQNRHVEVPQGRVEWLQEVAPQGSVAPPKPDSKVP